MPQPIYFTPGAPLRLLSRSRQTVPLNKCDVSFSPSVGFCFLLSPPSSLTCRVVSHLFISDSETTEDETTEPQMETKEGPGRHQDKAGRRGPSGKLLDYVLAADMSSFSELLKPSDCCQNSESVWIDRCNREFFLSSWPKACVG